MPSYGPQLTGTACQRENLTACGRQMATRDGGIVAPHECESGRCDEKMLQADAPNIDADCEFFWHVGIVKNGESPIFSGRRAGRVRRTNNTMIESIFANWMPFHAMMGGFD
jgi:hypothetical protein